MTDNKKRTKGHSPSQFATIPLCVVLHPKINRFDCAIYYHISRIINDGHSFFQRNGFIANCFAVKDRKNYKISKPSTRTVQRSLSKLKEFGFIECESAANPRFLTTCGFRNANFWNETYSFVGNFNERLKKAIPQKDEQFFLAVPISLLLNPNLTKKDMLAFWLFYICYEFWPHNITVKNVAEILNISRKTLYLACCRLKKFKYDEGYIEQLKNKKQEPVKRHSPYVAIYKKAAGFGQKAKKQ